ncbi:MAG: UbiX family flavin prenyltransferase [Candidatus Methanoplasma sp.]|jgi:4-hydroxy-3-polyprenylbenzoate decarboxylase|nr:UbiX family flavin prenyltransferase [Candidatus Methanoplasma sp.]
MRSVVAITGASGSIYGIRLLEELPGEKILVLSETAKQIVLAETGMSVEDVEDLADIVCGDDDLAAPISSGSFKIDRMFVAPCSSSSIAKFACGIADTLISRTVAVCLKERRDLILVPRETPKSQIMLENELKLARCGAVILDANPGFYPGPTSVDDMVDFVVGKCLDAAGIENSLFRRWG